MPGAAKHNWPDLRARFLGGEWLNLERMAVTLGISPSAVRKRAADEKWYEQRLSMEQQAEAASRVRILAKLTQEFEKRLGGMLDTADVLRFSGLRTLGKEGNVLNNAEAIKALATATDIEREIFLRHGRQIGGPDEEGQPITPVPVLPESPGTMQMPTSISEINDAHLVSILNQDGSLVRHLGGGLAPAKDGDQPAGRSRRKPAPKSSPA